VAKPEWGNKHVCQNCGARFYDLRKDTPVCPSCGTTQDTKVRTTTRKAKAEPPKPVKERRPPPAPAAETPEPEFASEAEEDEKDDALEDTSDLGEDEDIGEVIEPESEER